MSGACPACGGPLAAWREVARCPLARCAACGSAVTHAPAPAFAAAYDAVPQPRLARVAAPVLALFDRRRLALLARAGAGPPGALLDAGAGRGRFVAAARAAGWDARGIEPAARGVEAARAAYGVRLERAAIADADVAPASLDAVSLWHVLEHLEEPGAALARVAGWLRPGGALLVGVPNVASAQARLGGARWLHWDLPRHRTHLTPRGLRTLLARHGFEVLHESHLLLEHNPIGLWLSLLNRVTPTANWLFHALRREAPLRAADAIPTLLAIPLAPLAVVLEACFGAARRGGTIAVVARRR